MGYLAYQVVQDFFYQQYYQVIIRDYNQRLCKDPDEPISTMECHKGFESCSSGLTAKAFGSDQTAK